jgi:hypothetical protein
MHDELWAGVTFKLDNARFHFGKMGQSLGPPPNTYENVVQQSAGAIIDTGWRLSINAYLDAFLSATRSVAEVINCCFGHDPNWRLKGWFDSRSPNEQCRRRQFSELFRDDYQQFVKQALSTERNISEHRRGFPKVSITITGMFGRYHGDLVNPVPITESPKITDPDLAFLARPRPIYPTAGDFKIDEYDLFEACRAYLKRAESLRASAQAIAQQVHGDKPLTPPPG